ncbi:MAG: penicillin acylase family protein, partial [Dehalococcoidia bacterium]
MTDNDKEKTTANSEAKPPKKKKKGGKSNLITALVILAIIVILVGGGAGYFNYINNAPLPKVDGNVKVNGLYDKVEVIRDSNGIPHIYAGNMHDLNFAQGYIQAQDRWWQMEMFRHICGGRIEELTGKKASLVSTDIYLRTLGWYNVAEQEYANYTPEQRAPLDAFAAGVNAYISKRSPQDLSVNYSILGLTGVKFKIEPWTPVDTLAFGKLMCYDLGYSGDEEIQRTKLYSALGQETADKWQTPPWGYGDKPTVIHEADVQAMEKSTAPAAPAGDTSATPGQPVTSIQAYDDPRPDLSWVMGSCA